MSYVVAMPLDEGGSVLVEISDNDTDADGIERVGRTRDAATSASQTLQAALRQVKPAVRAVLAGVQDMVERPDKVAVQFGIKFTASAGVVVAKAASEANFTVIVEWVQTPPT